MTFNIQVMSDLHLETHPSYDYDFPQTAPHLALLGDIGHVGKNQLIEFLVRQLLRYKIVFFLLGNHEPYNLRMNFARGKMRKFSSTAARLRADDDTIGEFVFLEKTRFDVNEQLTVLGCTLFSNVPSEHALAVQERVIDFRDMLDWDVGDHVDAHTEDLSWLNSQVASLSQSGRKIIIFTHYSPTGDSRARNPRYPIGEMDSAFVTDLSREECWTDPAVVLWGFGHTHYSCDFVDDLGKRIVANQKGYFLIPQKAFQPSKVVEIVYSGNRETGSTESHSDKQ